VTEPTQHTIDAAGVNLSVLSIGNPDNPPVVFVHGMRDVAWSLLPVAEALIDQYHVLLPELRGHGRSDHPGSYAFENFVFDLHCVLDQMTQTPVAFIGHSLGGHITSRYAALFPEQVNALVMVEGLGPPDALHSPNPEAALAGYATRILQLYGEPADQRSLPSYEFAAERLLKNNPRLDPDRALVIAHKAVRADPDGTLHWAFDSRAQMVFVSAGLTPSDIFWRAVQCPALIISGDLAHEYWGTRNPHDEHFDGSYAPGEMEARASIFPKGEHLHFTHSGHMVHYDEPERLATETLNFLEKHL
jgi:pimeloyl-ACP methyl ester carboxylesterase